MKKQYLDFFDSHGQTVMHCRQIVEGMAGFYLLLSGIDGAPKADQRKALHASMAAILQAMENLAAEIQKHQ